MKIEFEAEGFDEIGDRLKGAGTHTRITLNEGLRAIGHLVTPILKRNTPRGVTGNLRSKTRFQIIGGPGFQELQIRQGSKSSSGFFYGRVVRGGRRPGRMPPVTALIPWVIGKLGVSTDRARSVAFLVARKIGQKGIKARPYHKEALQQSQAGIRRIVEQMGVKVVAYLAGG